MARVITLQSKYGCLLQVKQGDYSEEVIDVGRDVISTFNPHGQKNRLQPNFKRWNFQPLVFHPV